MKKLKTIRGHSLNEIFELWLDNETKITGMTTDYAIQRQEGASSILSFIENLEVRK
jgi:hypothetical protein